MSASRGHEARIPLFNFIASGDLKVDWALRIDPLTAVMLVVVTTVSALVHLYSIGYMADDPYKPRFFSYLSFFTFAMLMLVTADNLAQLFFGWEGVGLASYLLIGFWYPQAGGQRRGDQGLRRQPHRRFRLRARHFRRVPAHRLDRFRHHLRAGAGARRQELPLLGFDADALTVICLLLFMGAMGKSAQFLLHTWLPDAMEGPTPVSALIHAATMVTAGVFMVARLSPLFELAPTAAAFVTFIGATTAIFAATVGLVQNDIKRIIAYSTCSQLGYMFVAMGVGAYSVGMFHLFTHAFFKALLFLGSGSVILAMHHEQDIRNMGGLWRKIPFTYATMLVGTLALTGFPFTAGYFSKDAIIEAAAVGTNPMAVYGFVMTVAAAALTSFYSWRLIFKTFHGEPHDHHHYEAAHESAEGDAGSARRPGGRLDRRRLAVSQLFHRPRRRRILPRVAEVRTRQHRARGHGASAAADLAGADGHDGRRIFGGLAVLYPAARSAGGAGAKPTRALPLPAQQLVFRRASTTSSSFVRRCGSAGCCGRAATVSSSTASGLTASPRACSTSPATWCGCRPVISTTTPLPC